MKETANWLLPSKTFCHTGLLLKVSVTVQIMQIFSFFYILTRQDFFLFIYIHKKPDDEGVEDQERNINMEVMVGEEESAPELGEYK